MFRTECFIGGSAVQHMPLRMGQILYPRKQYSTFFITTGMSCIDMYREKSPGYHARERGVQCRQCALRMCCKTVLASGQIAQIEHGTVNGCFWREMLVQMLVPVQHKADAARKTVLFQPGASGGEGRLLHVKGPDFARLPHALRQKERIVSIARRAVQHPQHGRRPRCFRSLPGGPQGPAQGIVGHRAQSGGMHGYCTVSLSGAPACSPAALICVAHSFT